MQDMMKRVRDLNVTAEMYRSMFHNSRAVMLIIDTDKDGEIIDANEAAVAFYGWPLEKLLGMRIGDINTLSGEEIAAEMRNAVSNNRNTFQFRHRLSDGSERDVEVMSGNIGTNGDHKLFSIVTDVTERKKAEETARRLSDFPELNANPVFAITLDRKVVYANPATRKLIADLGLSGVDDLVAGRYTGNIALIRNRMINRFKCEIEMGARVFEVNAQFAESDQSLRFYLSDVTKRRKAEKELMESEEKYRRIVETANDGILLLDENGKILFANRRITGLLGFEGSELAGKSFKEIQDLSGPSAGNCNEAPVENECKLVRKNGLPLWVSVRYSSPFEFQANASASIAMLTDITQRKAMEAEREKHIAELREALSSVKRLQGMLPICMYCKKIRNDKGYWEQVESYISEHSEALFTHSLCEECYKKKFPDFYEQDKEPA
jgi:PAS domain S-box-containing protein